jgi:SAM-dependent methyltransferase
MPIGYTVRASAVMLRHPAQAIERIRGRWDRRADRRALVAAGLSARVLYAAAEDWEQRLHAALNLPWPCPEAVSFEPIWDGIVADLTEAGARVGIASYGGWNDGDRAFSKAIWCLVAHLQAETVVETGVAHGLTSRVILEGLNRNGKGHLWSIDLPAVDSALHSEIGMAVPRDMRSPWTYVQGTARERLPDVLSELGALDLFIHDSLHTGRNQRFELESAWAALRPGGVAVIDDIDHSLAFRTFIGEARPRAWLAARHVAGPGLMGPDGLWGLAVRDADSVGSAVPAPGPQTAYLPITQGRATRAASLRAIEASPHFRALRTLISSSTVRDRRHGQLELSIARELAFVIRTLPLTGGRMLQIQPVQADEVLLYRDQLARPERPIIYDQTDECDPDIKAEIDFEEVDFEKACWPASDNYFDIVIWNREIVTVKNVMSALREVRRVLRPGGAFVLAVPNLAAIHNRLLLLAGHQPTTLHISNGNHVRGFAAPALTRVLKRDLELHVEQLIGVGIAPVTSAHLPHPLRRLGHTAIWVLRKPGQT